MGCLGVKSASCSSNEFKCGDGTCIPVQWKCDMEQGKWLDGDDNDGKLTTFTCLIKCHLGVYSFCV